MAKMVTVKEASASFLLSCRVEGRSPATLSNYRYSLQSLHWYADKYGWPEDITKLTTDHFREFLVYLRETDHRFESDCPRAQKPLSRATVRAYYRILSSWGNWLQREGILEYSPLAKIKAPTTERKVVHALNVSDVERILASFGDSYEGVRNKAIVLVLVDCGLRLGELVGLRMDNIDMGVQILRVTGKTGERLGRFGSLTTIALSQYLALREGVEGSDDHLWLVREGTALTAAGVADMFCRMAKVTGVEVHAHLLRHTMATMWLKNGGDSIQLQRLLGHTTLTMTARYVQSVSCDDAIKSHVKHGPVDNLGKL